jgi:hypothetical protein
VPAIPATWGSPNKRITVQASPGIKQDPISKITNAKTAVRVAQVEASKVKFNPQHKQVFSTVHSTDG